MTHQGAACDAASEHFRHSITSTDILVTVDKRIYMAISIGAIWTDKELNDFITLNNPLSAMKLVGNNKDLRYIVMLYR